MRKQFTRTLALLLCILTLCSVLPLYASADTHPLSGECGKNLTWDLNTETGVLTIRGTGDMYYYSYPYYVPWWYDNDKIRSVVIEEGVTNISIYAFYGCENMEEVSIPDTVTEILGQSFTDCSSLKSITIPASVTNFAAWNDPTNGMIFLGCDALESVYYTGTLEEWCAIDFGVSGSNPVCYAGSLYIQDRLLTKVKIPSSLTVIKPYTFFKCTSLTEVTVPDSITNIGAYAFWSCPNLTRAKIGNGVLILNPEVFYGCENLGVVTLGSGLKLVGDHAFGNCYSLYRVTYNGSKSQWNSVMVDDGNEQLFMARWFYRPMAAFWASIRAFFVRLFSRGTEQ